MKILLIYNKKYYMLTKYNNGTWRMRDIFKQDSAQINAKTAEKFIKKGTVIKNEQ